MSGICFCELFVAFLTGDLLINCMKFSQKEIYVNHAVTLNRSTVSKDVYLN